MNLLFKVGLSCAYIPSLLVVALFGVGWGGGRGLESRPVQQSGICYPVVMSVTCGTDYS